MFMQEKDESLGDISDGVAVAASVDKVDVRVEWGAEVGEMSLKSGARVELNAGLMPRSCSPKCRTRSRHRVHIHPPRTGCIQVSECRRRRGIGQIVRRNIHSLDRCDGAGFGKADARASPLFRIPNSKEIVMFRYYLGLALRRKENVRRLDIPVRQSLLPGAEQAGGTFLHDPQRFVDLDFLADVDDVAKIAALAEKLAKSNPEAVARIKRTVWANTDNWPQLLDERAAMSGKLVLSKFTRDAIASFEKR